MSMYKGVSPGSVGGCSMWTPMAKGDTSKMWSSFNAKPGMGKAQGSKPANPSGGGKK